MNRRTRESLALLSLVAAGCAQQKEAIAPRSPVAMRDSAVSVQAPFVNVRIGEPKSTRTADAEIDDDVDQYDEAEFAEAEE
jgi:hypothetical protein